MSNATGAAQVTVTELHERTGATLREVRRGRQVEVIDRYGDAVAVILPAGAVPQAREAVASV